MFDVFIGIGGNLGDRVENITKAIDTLSPILFDFQCSKFYKTEPRDYFDQDFFLNIVVKGKTDLLPLEFLKITQEIENRGGRTRNNKIPKGPRLIDLDILLYGTLIIDSQVLCIPHREIKNRKFVLIPLLELEPELVEPESNIPYWNFLNTVGNQGVYCSSLNDYNKLFL
jgi:2-amino-4-hydroxy-6-hydroxymethyldihydropteridine diphosphokinase